MTKKVILGVLFLLGVTGIYAKAENSSSIELLLAEGTFYSITDHSYRSLRLPEGWSVLASAYSPDTQSLAMVLRGSHTVSKPLPKSTRPLIEGSIQKTMRPWGDSTHLLLLNRRTGIVQRSWRLPDMDPPSAWTLQWLNASQVAAGHLDQVWTINVLQNMTPKPQVKVPVTIPPTPSAACPRLLAETRFQNKNECFMLYSASCSTTTETSDFYRLVRDNEHTHKDTILWEYRVTADTTTCSEAYACYSGSDVQFLATADRLFLVWDGDLYEASESDDGMEVELLTQLLPQYSHPLGIAVGKTNLNSLDVAIKVAYQPVSPSLTISRGDVPLLYAQNFCATKSFHAAIGIGSFEQNLMLPAGYQVGPVSIEGFKDRAYTPVLITVTWTAFHRIADPIFCKLPYTLAAHTTGIAVSLLENDKGMLDCQIHTYEDHR